MTTVGTREQIIDRIVTVLGGISGVRVAARNRADLADVAGTGIEVFPAIVLLDGAEMMLSSILPQKSVLMPPALMRLRPEIFVLLRQRDDVKNTTLDGQPAPVGPELSFWRDAVLSALINDSVLVGDGGRTSGGLLTTSGQIVYQGCQTDMASGRTLWGQLQVFIDFHYPWFPPR